MSIKFKTYPLDGICRLQMGKTPKREKTEYWGEGFPWVSIADMKGKFIENTKEQITSKAIEECGCKIVRKGSLLLSFKLSIGKLGFAATDLFTNEAIVALLIRDYNEIYPEYLYYVLKTLPLRGRNVAAKGLTLNTASLKKILVPIPEKYEDQIRIANILQKLGSIIEERKISKDLLDEYLISSFEKIFGNPYTNPYKLQFTELEKLCSEIVDCPHSTPKKAATITEYPCIRTSELKKGYILWDSMQYLDEVEYLKRTQRLIPKEGDIVYGREGTYGNAVRIPKTHKFSLGQRTVLFRPNSKKCNTDFLWAMLRSDFVYNQAKKKNNSSTVGHVNVKDIRKFKIFEPTIKSQNQFSKIVKTIDQLRIEFIESLTHLFELQGVLTQKIFSGKIDLVKLDVATEMKSIAELIETSAPLIEEEERKRRPRTTKVDNLTLTNYYESEFTTMIKTHFSKYHFRFKDIEEMFSEEDGGILIYFTTQELKQTKEKSPKDIQTFIFDCVEKKNKNLKLNQMFYDAFSDLSLKKIKLKAGNENVLKQVNDSKISREELSGIYFQITK